MEEGYVMDKAIEYCLRNEFKGNWAPMNVLVHEIGCTKQEMVDAYFNINMEYPKSIMKSDDNLNLYFLLKGSRIELEHLLRNGGFVNLYKSRKQAKIEERQTKTQQLLKMQLEIDALRGSVRDTAISRRLSIVAIVIAGLALCWEIVSSFLK